MAKIIYSQAYTIIGHQRPVDASVSVKKGDHNMCASNVFNCTPFFPFRASFPHIVALSDVRIRCEDRGVNGAFQIKPH